MTITLWERIIIVDIPILDLCMCFLSKYVLNGMYPRDTDR